MEEACSSGNTGDKSQEEPRAKEVDLMPNLYCVDLAWEIDGKGGSEKPRPVNAEYEAYLSSHYWAASYFRRMAHENFVLLSPLVGLAPLVLLCDLYGGRMNFAFFVMYLAMGIEFINNTGRWLFYLNQIRAEYGARVTRKLGAGLQLAAHSVMLVSFFLGAMTIAYFIAVGDRALKNAAPETLAANFMAEPKSAGLVPWVTARVHSVSGVCLTYFVTAPFIAAFFVIENIQMYVAQEDRKYVYTSYRWKIFLIAALILSHVALRQAKMVYLGKGPLHRLLDFKYVVLASAGYFFGVGLAKEIVLKIKAASSRPERLRKEEALQAAELAFVVAALTVNMGTTVFVLAHAAAHGWGAMVKKVG